MAGTTVTLSVLRETQIQAAIPPLCPACGTALDGEGALIERAFTETMIACRRTEDGIDYDSSVSVMGNALVTAFECSKCEHAVVSAQRPDLAASPPVPGTQAVECSNEPLATFLKEYDPELYDQVAATAAQPLSAQLAAIKQIVETWSKRGLDVDDVLVAIWIEQFKPLGHAAA
jgi:hypothetical protein